MENKLRGFEVVRDEFRKTEGEVKLPTRATKHSAGYDFYLPCDIKLKPNERTGIIPTDVKAYMQEDEVLSLHIRSSIGIKKGVILSNVTGIVDSDYFSNPDNDGNIGIALYNTTDKVVKLKKGERIMQGVFSKLNEFDFTITKFAYYFKSYDDLDGNWYYDYYVIYHNKFFEHLLNNKLVIEEPNLLYPFSTFERSLRYTQYGYNLCRQSKINLLMCIRNTENFDENDLSRSLYVGLD